MGTATAESVFAATSSISTSTPRFPGDPGRGRMYYGASTEQDVSVWESRMGQRLALHRTYYKANQVDRMVKVARADLSARRLPHVSTKLPGGNWAAVAAGKHDDWLREMADKLARLDRPIFLTFHHEPENNANRTTRRPTDFVEMQTRIIRVFASRAPKVTIVPVLQGWSFSKYNRRSHPERWDVPDAKVYGVDVYNPFSSNDPKWVPFQEKLDLIRPYAKGRPIAIGEYGCRNDPENPERAAQWMRDAFRYGRHHNVVSMSYFNSSRHSPEGSWALEGKRAEVFERRLASTNIVRPDAI